MNHQHINTIIEKVERCVRFGDFEDARQTVQELSDSSPEVVKYKKSLLAQIDQAQAVAELPQKIQETVDLVKQCVQEEKFKEARAAVTALPAQMKGVTELKKNLMDQISQAECTVYVNHRVEKTIAAVKQLVLHQRYYDARQVVMTLPQQSPHMRPAQVAQLEALKTNLLGQIDKMEQQH